jgi:hypothetical protein
MSVTFDYFTHAKATSVKRDSSDLVHMPLSYGSNLEA